MKHLLSVIAFTLLLASPLFSQTFFRTYSSPYEQVAHDLVQSREGGFVMVGERKYANGKTDGLVVKIDNQGDTVWARTFGGAYDENFNSITICHDSSYLVAGKTFSYGVGTPYSSNWYLLKLDENGDTLWTWVYDLVCFDELFHAIQSADGGYLLCGYRFGSTPPKQGVVFKLDSARSMVWSFDIPKNYSNGSYGFEVMEEPNGDVLAGVYSSAWDMLRLHPNGTIKQFLMHTSILDHVVDFVPALGGGYAALLMDYYGGNYRSAVIRLDSNLNQVWIQGLDSVFYNFNLTPLELRKHMSIDLTTEGYVVTRTHGNGVFNEVGIAVLDTAGHVLSSGTCGTAFGNEIHHGIRLGDGRIAACGYANVGVGNPELLFVMADPTGNVTPVPSVAPLYPNGTDTICQGDSLTLSTDSGYYFTYLWTLDNLPLPINKHIIQATQAGTYRVEVGDGLAQSDSSETLLLTVDQISIDLGPDTIVHTASIMLDAGPGYTTYLWSTGATTQSIILPADSVGMISTIAVEVWNNLACAASDSVSITWGSYIGIGEETTAARLFCRLYPNPAEERITLEMSQAGEGMLSFDILAPTGNIIRHYELEASVTRHEIELGDLAPGIYFWTLGEPICLSGKFIRK